MFVCVVYYEWTVCILVISGCVICVVTERNGAKKEDAEKMKFLEQLRAEIPKEIAKVKPYNF